MDDMVNFEQQFTHSPSPEEEVKGGSIENIDKHAESSLIENPSAVKNLIEEKLLGPRAAFAVIDLVRTQKEIMQKYFPELLETIGRRHVPEGETATRHKEGDVWKHTLRVIAALERKEFIQAIREAYDVAEEVPDDRVRHMVFEKCGTEFAWALLLHDIGKVDTAQERERTLRNGKIVRHFSFHGHSERSGEMFEEIAQRLGLEGREPEKIHKLIVDHMLMHKIAREGDVDYDVKEELFQNPNREALLIFQLADALGNYTDEINADQKVTAFHNAREEMKIYDQEVMSQSQRRHAM
jgi:hypothetical protein